MPSRIATDLFSPSTFSVRPNRSKVPPSVISARYLTATWVSRLDSAMLAFCTCASIVFSTNERLAGSSAL